MQIRTKELKKVATVISKAAGMSDEDPMTCLLNLHTENSMLVLSVLGFNSTYMYGFVPCTDTLISTTVDLSEFMAAVKEVKEDDLTITCNENELLLDDKSIKIVVNGVGDKITFPDHRKDLKWDHITNNLSDILKFLKPVVADKDAELFYYRSLYFYKDNTYSTDMNSAGVYHSNLFSNYDKLLLSYEVVDLLQKFDEDISFKIIDNVGYFKCDSYYLIAKVNVGIDYYQLEDVMNLFNADRQSTLTVSKSSVSEFKKNYKFLDQKLNYLTALTAPISISAPYYDLNGNLVPRNVDMDASGDCNMKKYINLEHFLKCLSSIKSNGTIKCCDSEECIEVDIDNGAYILDTPLKEE